VQNMMQVKKQQLRDQMDAAIKARELMRTSLRDLKASMKFTTIEQIDEAIEKLEKELQHSSLSLNEEKKTLEDIRKLKASRATVGVYSEKLQSLAQDDVVRGELQTSMKEIDDHLSTIKSEEDKVREELTALRQKDQKVGMDMTALVSEREACRETCKQAYEQIKDLRAAHDLVWQEFRTQEKLWKAQEYEERAKKREQAAAERAAREAAKAARLAEMAPEPFFKEITMCEQLSAYLSRFVARNVTAGAGARDDKKDDAPVAAGIQGMKVFKRQDDEDDDLSRLFGPGGKKTKGAKKGGSSLSASSAVSDKLVHSLDMLEAFATLKISVPTSISTIPSTLDIVNQRKEDYLKKREVEKAKKESEQLDVQTQNAVMSQEADQIADPSLEAPSNGSEIKAEPADEVSKATKPSKKQLQKQLQKPPSLDDAMSWPAMGAGDATGKTGDQLQMNSSMSSVSVSIEVSETNAAVTLSISPQI
jgi:uncharacterized coiled-coil DUF342 family protein